ncbi:ABC-type nitrate/sulfonate/bicarbonate transport system ATPase subunit/ABC-type nitrate/sulfonate/bicarbonate transport system permease component [Clostridium beijerinckii]|nr:ABC transporter permease subunit [Clostridium beijerinckii]NYC08047.1 ABC-type nitrate/sulfonate/bicarbonate transport system ATPase subunit/ABC-type nitrate/sulfonate/bicarbonate transport system permease component [Clostridium beijerinckii]
MKALEINNLSFGYKDSGKLIVDDLSFDINKNEFVTIIAPSGTGKSTLFRLILGLLKPQKGNINILKDGNKNIIGYMPQKDSLMPWRNILDNTAVGLELNGYSKKEARKVAATYFEGFGLKGTEKYYPHELSGGMRQRASFLRAIVNNPSIILLDEPFSSLDALTRRKMQSWLLDLCQRQSNTVFMITHDIEEALLLSDRILICTELPYRNLKSIDVNIERPRNYETTLSSEFIELKRSILNVLDSLEENKGGYRMKKIKDYIFPLIFLIIIILAWEFIIPYFKVPNFILPRFSEIIKALVDQKDLIYKHSLITLGEALLGLIASVIIGISCALSIYLWRNVSKTLYPIIIFSQTIPTIALSPIMVMWFGYTIWSKVAVVILFCFFPIVISTLDGLNSVDRDLEDVLKALGGNRFQIFFKLHMNSVLPNFLSSFKIAATYSISGATIGEWLGAEKGLGIYIKRAAGMLQADSVFAGVLVLSFLGLILFSVGFLLEKILLKYRRGLKEDNHEIKKA